MGGPDVALQYLRAGLVEQISIHLVPVLLGGGTSLFAQLGHDHIELEPLETISTPHATHLRYRVLNN